MSTHTQLPTLSPPAHGNPYKGLHFYTEEDRSIFFGRDRETQDFLQILQRDTLSVLFAPSGLGKTSLLRAGIIPRLREEGFLPVIVRVDYTASAPHPTRQIVEAILAAAAATELDVEPADSSLPSSSPDDWGDTLWEFFHKCRLWGPRNDLVSPVLILDQFEEVFTLGRTSPQSIDFLDQLADLSENRMPFSVQKRIEATGERPTFDTRAHAYRLVLSLREDFVSRLDSLRPMMPSVMRNRFALGHLDRERGVEVVLRAGSRWIAQAVAIAIVAAVAGESRAREREAGACPLGAEIEPAYLSVMCHELFRRMVELGRTEIGSDLVAEEQGNILDALYERSFEGLNSGVRLFIEDHLLTASGFRGSIPLAEAEREGIALSHLETLVDRRLLRFEDRLGATHVELSHDLLTRVVAKSRDRRIAEAALEAQQKREEEFRARLRRMRLQAFMGVAAVVVLLGAIAFYLFGWVIPHHGYYRSFSNRLGVIYPFGPLPSSAVAHRPWTLRVISEGWFGKIRTAEVIDANFQLTDNHQIATYLSEDKAPDTNRERESRYEFIYDREGHVVYEVAWNRFGQMCWGLVYAPHVDDADHTPKRAKAMFLGPDGYPQPQGRSRAEFVEITYDERGFEARYRYSDREGHPMPGRDNAYGRRMEYDEKGRIIRQISLDEHGEPMNDEAANAGTEIQYDAHGNVIVERAFDARNEPTLVKNGFYGMSRTYDKWGRETENRFFGLSGQSVVENEETQAHRLTCAYDDRGNITSIKVFDTSDQPVIAGTGIFSFAAHEERKTFNSESLLETLSYFDGDQNPLTGPEGWHSLRCEYDERGFLASIGYFDGQGSPVVDKATGAHRVERVNDALGQPVEERFFDTDRKAITTLDGGYHVRKNVYDKAGNMVEQSYFGIEGEPVPDLHDGAHRFASSFDRFRHPLLTRYFDAEGEPVNNTQGFHKSESTYDDYGSELSTRWYDKKGQPCNGPEGVHSKTYTYDDRGLLISILRHDSMHQPAADAGGIHETLYSYNGKRQQTSLQLFGLDRKPTEDEEGNHLVLNEYDERGRQTKLTKLRADGTPNLDAELRIATRTSIYDKEGRWIEQAYYDAAGNLVTGPWGYAKGSFLNEPDGRIAEVHCGIDGKPMFNPLSGYAIKKTDMRMRGKGIDSTHGPDGGLIDGPEGYAEVHQHWTDDAKLLSEAYFGANGSPVAGPRGYHRVEITQGESAPNRRYFDSENREIHLPGSDVEVFVIFVKQIIDVKQPAAKGGFQAGDILWQYGTWSFPEALKTEQEKGTGPDDITGRVFQALIAERDRLSAESVPMTVIRHGKALTLTMPPLPQKSFGMQLQDRAIPLTTFQQWKAMCQKAPSGTSDEP